MQETADFFNDSAVMLAAEGCHNEAIACLRRGLQLEPYSSLMWFNLGLSYYALDDKDNSRYALYESALTLDPLSEDTLFNLRDTYTMLGIKKLAKKCSKIIDRLALKNPNTPVQKRDNQ